MLNLRYQVGRFTFSGMMLALSALVLLGCEKKPGTMGLGSGTAEGFGGDEPYREAFSEIRYEMLASELVSLQAAPTSEDFCDLQQYCVGQVSAMCSKAPVLSANEKNYCNSFLRSNAPAAAATLNNASVVIEGMHQPIYVDGVRVNARTNLAPTGKISLDLDLLNQASLDKNQIAVIILHEIFHKVPVSGVHLDDETVVGPFGQGLGAARLFTALGYAVVFRYLHHRNVQINGQYPTVALYTSGMTQYSGVTYPNNIPTASRFQIGNDFSWSFNMQTVSPQVDLTSYTNTLISKGDETSGNPYRCDLHNHTSIFNPGRIECGQRDAGNIFADTVISVRRVDDGNVHHIVFARSGPAMRIYIDGVLDIERILLFPNTITQNAHAFQIANYGGKQRFKGKIGMFFMWKQVFSPLQIGGLEDLLKFLVPWL